MKFSQSFTRKIIRILECILLLCACYVCGLKGEQQKFLRETNDSKIEAFAGSDEKAADRPPIDGKDAKTTGKPVADEMIQETEETPYPLLLTPKGTKNIEFAIESEDIFCIYNGEKYGYLKKNGEEITEYIYDAAYPFSEGLACVMVNGKYGFIDENGEEVLPLQYEDAAPFQEGLAYFAAEDEYGFMTKDGTPAFYLDCDSVSSFREGLAYFSLDGKYGYIDKTGQVVIEPLYSDADYFKDDLAFIEIEGHKGAINTKGEIVIPVKYDDMNRSGDYICAWVGNIVSPDEYDYYTLSGDVVSKEEYENRNLSDDMAYPDENENIYMIQEDSRITITDKKGKILLSVKCDYVSSDIYRDYRNYILRRYGDDKQDHILILAENKEADISDTLLKNSITPRIELYWQLTHGKNIEIIYPDNEVAKVQLFDTWNELNYIKKIKLHNVSHSELPVLLAYEKPCIKIGFGFPMSDSTIYGIRDNQLQCLVRGEECGGSARGDYVCFWRDVQSGEILIGNRGNAGGFGGYAVYGSIYKYEEGNAAIIFDYEWIRQDRENYSGQDLYNNAHLFYDDNEVPYTQESIQEAESVNEYTVKEDRVSIEDYEDACSRYQYFNVY